jgi:hypothetical protein
MVWRCKMGYPETMRDIRKEVRRNGIRSKRKELENSPSIDHEHAEEFVKSAIDNLSKGKQESNGK